jgi:cytochrome d ubiquinol oxidase subunit II
LEFAGFVTPVFLGSIAGSIISERIYLQAENFLSAYVFSWWHWFSVAVGLFTVSGSIFILPAFLLILQFPESSLQRARLSLKFKNNFR